MKKIISYFILTIAIISSPLYADMEQTQQCKDEIQRLENEIKKLQEEEAELAALKVNRNQWQSLPLIPSFWLTWKLQDCDRKIKELTDKDLDGKIQEKKSKLNEEKAKLQAPRTIRITKIKVTAAGEWDADASAPDIAIYVDHRKIADVSDEYSHTFELYENVTDASYLNIYDKDIAVDDLMAKVVLEKFRDQKGVVGDSCTIERSGKNEIDQRCVTNYTITYEVSF